MARHPRPTSLLALLPLLGLGCGLIKINGKPLFAGKEAPAGSNAAAEEPGSSGSSGSGSAADGGGATMADAPANADDRQRLSEAIDSGNAANHDLFEAAKKDEVPADLLARLAAAEATAKELGAASSAQFFGIRRYGYEYLAALRAADEGDTGPIAELMGGTVVGKGVAGSKAPKIDVKVKKDHCYVIAMRWRQPTGTEEIRDYEWTSKSPSKIQRFRQDYVHPYTPWAFGVCGTADTTATFSAKYHASGTKDRLQYVVMSWKRSEMPLEQAMHTSVLIPDPCSAPSWKALWTNPIPGSIVYYDDEPVLITNITAGQRQVSMVEADAGQRAGSTTRLRDEPKDAPRFSGFRMPKCWSSEGAESSLSRKAAKCHEAIDAKYDARFDAVDRQLSNARTIAAAEQAERKREQLVNAEGKERRSKCSGVDQQLGKEVERTYDEIVDLFNDGHAPPSMGRVAALDSE